MRTSALSQGIKAVAVGKRGSKPIPVEIIDDIIRELKACQVSEVARGAFFGALFIKGITEEEKKLSEAFEKEIIHDPQRLTEALASDAPEFVKEVCVRLLNKETMDLKTARRVGIFLFSDEAGDGARGMIASILRVRYETPDEYQGILECMQDTLETPFKEPAPPGEQVVQLAEPFDGVDHSNMITPLLARHVQSLGYRAVSLVGRNSGPKYGNNLLDIARAVNGTVVRGNTDLAGAKPDFGWYINQQDMSKPIDKWVELRREIIKRPFLSTLERFVNPARADILIASAFHPPYGEKMLTIGERADFPGVIIVRNGIEGTCAFPLKRDALVLCSARQKDGTYKREEFKYDPKELLGELPDVEEKLENPSLEKNAQLIKDYQSRGESGYGLFDNRVKVTCAGLEKAIKLIREC